MYKPLRPLFFLRFFDFFKNILSFFFFQKNFVCFFCDFFLYFFIFLKKKFFQFFPVF